jgi:hypothetical protein
LKTTTTPHTTITTSKTLTGTDRAALAAWHRNGVTAHAAGQVYAEQRSPQDQAGWTGPHQED